MDRRIPIRSGSLVALLVLIAGALLFSSAGIPGLGRGADIDPSNSACPTDPVGSAFAHAAGPGGPAMTSPATPQTGSGIDAARKRVDKLVDEQKFEEAAKETVSIREEAVKAKNEQLWAWALIKESQLRTALHGYETTVRFFKEQSWPTSPLQRDMLDLFYAQSLVTYYRAYSWEINQRERVEASGPIDLKAWTRDQIYAEAWAAVLRVWKDRGRLEDGRPADFPDFWSPGNYPAGIRDTLRDAVVYLMADLLADTSFWAPRQSNELFLLDLPALLSDARLSPDRAAAALESPSAHPLEKLHTLLAEHWGWCLRASRPEAAMEAYFVLVSSLHVSFPGKEDRALLYDRFASYLAAHRSFPWWATGQATLAEFLHDDPAPNALVRALTVARAGAELYPDSPGGLHCLSLVKRIEAADFALEAMASDAPSRRSILITHRNFSTLYLRAYPLDFEKLVAGARDYSIFPQGDAAAKIIQGTPPAASWEAALPATPDYRDHKTYANLPADLRPGLYLLAGSARAGFPQRENRVQALAVIVSDLVMLKRSSGEADNAGGVWGVIASGRDGRPVLGAKVDLYAYNWQTGHRVVQSQPTDAQGFFRFLPPTTPIAASRQRSHFLVAKKDADLAFDPEASLFIRQKPQETSSALIYTDRSVYRPGQKIFWKVLAYAGRRDLGRLRPAAGLPASVWLEDINGQRVAETTAATNDFGTASGEFMIPPAGRPLGEWRLRSSPAGVASIRVEEYKRPTFEVTVKDPEKPLRLNRPASFKAEARYYFGLPVSSGTVVWEVRSAGESFPLWWSREYPRMSVRTVAGGRVPIREDGTFEMTFTPKADERNSGSGISYRYTLTIDVTDDGGETRTVSRPFRVGFVTIEPQVMLENGFVRAGEPGKFSVSRVDLNGTPKPGKGTWRVARLLQPESTPLPADLPGPGAFFEEGAPKPYRTPGDEMRPRWEYPPNPHDILRLWKEGREMERGTLESGSQGEVSVLVAALEPGAYRFLYETKDVFGMLCRESEDFVVAPPDRRTPFRLTGSSPGPEGAAVLPSDPSPPTRATRRRASPAEQRFAIDRRSTDQPASTGAIRLPLIASAEFITVPVGGTARILLESGWDGQPMLFEAFRGGELWQRRWLTAGKDDGILEIPVTEDMRGGFGVQLTTIRDHQTITDGAALVVPWDNKDLDVAFSAFRDMLTPGAREAWRVTVKMPGGKAAEKGAAELLAYMYDRSLDLFAPHRAPSIGSLYPIRTQTAGWERPRPTAQMVAVMDYGWGSFPSYPTFRPAELVALGGYGIGGPGRRGGVEGGVVGGVLGGVVRERVAPMAADQSRRIDKKESMLSAQAVPKGKAAEEAGAGEAAVPLRTNFSETAFWQPHLLTGADGTAAIEFTVPDSVTGWRVFVHAVTKDLAGGSVEREAQSVKDLMVRPYLPRFFREGDRAELRVVVNDAGKTDLTGEVALEITDPATGENLAPAFGLPERVPGRPFGVKAGGGSTVVFPLAAPARVGTVAFKVTARAGAFSDGELRPLPVLPGRMHLVQSRFATLKGVGAGPVTRTLTFDDLRKNDDPTRLNEQLVVTVDAQLFYGLLEALPYLVNYPYECTEQTLNRFLSTGILTSLYVQYPAVARMAQALAARRDTPLETFDAADPNRKMALEETPWLVEARGGRDAGFGVEKVLDPRVAKAQREASLAKLLKAQTSLGAFPWWPGGPPSPYMTLYIVYGFSKAMEFGVEVPKGPVVKAFAYLHRHYLDEIVKEMMAHDAGWEFVTFLNYALSNFPDASWTGGVFTEKERAEMLGFSFKHWKEHSPYLKGFLALTLKRAGRGERVKDARLVWDSVMDSAKTTEDEGTSWAPEERGWLWYNDTTETHAFALRTLMELEPKDARSEGLVQWMFLDKKLNHWKSTRATAEVIYAVASWLRRTGALGVREAVAVRVCGTETRFTFEPDVYTGKKNQVVVPGEKMGGASAGAARVGVTGSKTGAAAAGQSSTGAAADCAAVTATKEGKGMAFVSATWHFSTERMPAKGEGDLFAIERTWFRRVKGGAKAAVATAKGGQAQGGSGDGEVVLRPLVEGEALAVGDEIEVHLSIRARHAAEYVHVRDPRPAGCEPVTLTSGYKWDLGLVRYEEVRDSGMNFFMEWVPEGEYTLKHRMRCAMTGTFKAGPATLQSMYAPEFAAYSSGSIIKVAKWGRASVSDCKNYR